MDGYKFTYHNWIHPDGKTRSDVIVWSRQPAVLRTSSLTLLPKWIADKFRANNDLHRVITTLEGDHICDHDRIR